MGKVLKKIGGIIGKVAAIASPILSVMKMIPGVGQIAGMVDAGLKIASNVGNILKAGFPKGLLQAAKMAVTSFLPGPLGKIADLAMNKIGAIKDLIPAGVMKAVGAVIPQAKGITDLLAT